MRSVGWKSNCGGPGNRVRRAYVSPCRRRVRCSSSIRPVAQFFSRERGEHVGDLGPCHVASPRVQGLGDGGVIQGPLLAAYRRGQHVNDQRVGQRGGGPADAELMARRQLLPGPAAVPAEIHVQAVAIAAGERAGAHQRQRRALHADMELRFQLFEGVADDGLRDPSGDGRFQIAALGKADALVPPQAGLVKTGNPGQGVVGPGVGVAGEVAQRLEAPVDTGARGVSQDLRECGQGGDAVFFEEGVQLGGVGFGWHEGLVT